MKAVTNRPEPDGRLSDPVYAARAWARFRWIMRWVIAAAMLSVGVALLFLKFAGAPMTAMVIIATVAGVALTVLLAGGLMGLIFLSSGSGHDQDVAGFRRDDGAGQWDRRR